MAPPKIRIHGIRSPVNAGAIMGRLAGMGDMQQLAASAVVQSGLIGAQPSAGALVGQPPLTYVATGNTTQSSSGSGTAGIISILGAGAVSIGVSLSQIVISAPASMGMTAIGNTTGSSSSTTRAITIETISFTGGVSGGFSGNSLIISGGTQTAAGLSIYAVGNTTTSTSSGVIAAGSLSFDGAGIVSVGISGSSVVISAPAGGGSATSMNMTAIGNTTGSSSATTRAITEWSISGAGAVSVGFTGNTFLISSPATVASAGTMNVTAVGNTTGSSSATTRTITAETISFTGGVSGGWSGNTLIISGATAVASATSMGMTAIGNTTGSSSSTTRQITIETISFTGGVSGGFSGNTLLISGATTTNGPAIAATLSHFIPYVGAGLSTDTTNGSMMLVPFDLQCNLSMNQVQFAAIKSYSTGTITISGTVIGSTTASGSGGFGNTNTLVFYSRSDATTFASFSSTTVFCGLTNLFSISISTNSVSTTLSQNFSWGQGSTTSSSQLTRSGTTSFVLSTTLATPPVGTSSFNGSMRFDVPFACSLPAGQYIMGIVASTATATGTVGGEGLTISAPLWNQGHQAITYAAPMRSYRTAPGGPSPFENFPYGVGLISTAGGTAPASFASTDIISNANVIMPYFEMGVF